MKYFLKIFFTIIIFSAFLFPSSVFAMIGFDDFLQIFNISIEPNQVKPNQIITIKAEIFNNSPIFFPTAQVNLFYLDQTYPFDNFSLNRDESYQNENECGGIYTNTYTIPENAQLGEYTVEITATVVMTGAYSKDNSGKFEVISSSDSNFFPKKYALNLWFDSEENYYPINPFFYVDDINGITGISSKYNYLALPEEDKKKNKFTVFYHIAETEDKSQWVYEYFFYYAYNKMPNLNEHYHDWEGVFVFVDKETEEVKRVVASAHGKWANNNEYFNPNFNSGEHAGIMIEGGSHANCVDRNNDGLFQWETDITNGPKPFAHGIYNRDINDKKHGYQIQPEIYNPNLIEITDDFISKFKNHRSFPNSPTLGFKCFNVPIFGGYKCISGVGGNSPEHPWYNEAYNEPEKIIPKYYNYIHGTINPLFIPGLSSPTMGIILIMSEEPYPFTFTDKNGEFLINNIPEGEHNIIVNLENYAPYKQRFIVEENGSEENEIIVGVNGILNLIPENESFRFEGIAKDEKGNLIINVPVDVYDKNNQKLFTTLTDGNGQYLFNLSSKNNHTIKIIQEDKIGEIKDVSADPGETIIEEIIVSNPKSLKENTLSELKEIETENKIIDKQINKIEKLIEESLDESLWIDDWHLEEKDYLGLKVFQKEINAAKRIEIILKYSKSKCRKNKCKDLKSILPILNKSAKDLSQSDYLLAEKLIQETEKVFKETKFDKSKKSDKRIIHSIEKNLKKAKDYSKKAKKQKLKKNYSRSVYHSARVWIFSKKAKHSLDLFLNKKG